MTSAPLHILVIGGGIGGLCLAQSLQASGVSVAVYERNPNSTGWLEGYRIHINPIGSRALYECLPTDLWEMFLAVTGKANAGIGFLTEHLQELVVLAEESMAGEEKETVNAHYPVSRMALRHLLLAGLKGVMHFNKTFERYEQAPDGRVTAFFADGSSAMGDVLVGADGANSRVCKQYLPQAQRVETGAVAIGSKFHLTKQSRTWLPNQFTERMNIVMPPKQHFLFTAVFERSTPTLPDEQNRIREKARAMGLNSELLFDTSQDYILWAFITHADTYGPDVHTLDGSALYQLVSQIMERWHPDLRRLIVESDPNSFTLLSLKTSVPITPWKSTPVTLLGDAIHSMTPVGGLGANMALRDANVLANKLIAVQQGKTKLLSAIGEYESEMREYGFTAVRSSLNYTRLAISGNRLTREFAKAWFRACNAIPLLKRVMVS